MPRVEVSAPLRYIDGKPHFKGQVKNYTVDEWNALDVNTKAAFRVVDDTDIVAAMIAEGGGGGVDSWDPTVSYEAGSEVSYGNSIWTTLVDVAVGVEPGRNPAPVSAGLDSTTINTVGAGASTGTFNQPFTPAQTITVDRVRYRAALTNPELSGMELRLGTSERGAEVATSGNTKFNKVDQDVNGWVTWNLSSPVTLQAGTTYHLNGKSTNTQLSYAVGANIIGLAGMTLGTFSYGTATTPTVGVITGGASAVFELIQTRVAPWTRTVQGGWNDKGQWDKHQTYSKYDLVTDRGCMYVASDDVPANIIPNVANLNYSEEIGRSALGASGTLGSTLMGSSFIPTAAMTVGVIRIYTSGSSTYATASVGFSSGIDANFAWIAKSVPRSVNVAGVAYVDFVLPAPVTLAAGVKVWVVAENFAAAGYTVSASALGGNATADAFRYGANLSTAWTGFPLAYSLRTPERIQKWVCKSSGYTSDADGSVVLADAAGLLLGNTTYGGSATKPERFFWHRAKRALRGGSASGAQWDSLGDSSIAYGYNCEATGSYSLSVGYESKANQTGSVALGQTSNCTGSYDFAVGLGNTVSGNYSQAMGADNTASGEYSHTSGRQNTASGNYSDVTGHQGLASRLLQAVRGVSRFAANGDAQICSMPFRIQTTNATATLLTAGGGALALTGTATNVLTIPASRVYKFRIEVAARRTDVAGEAAGWTFEGVVARDAAGNARMVGALEGKSWGDAGAAAWDVTPSINTADATNNYLALTVTGEVGKTIRWVANVDWVEVG